MGARVDPRGMSSDAELIVRSLTAPEAFGGVFDRHFIAVHRYLARRVGRERADDLASQTFTVAFERRASFRPEAVGARPWLLGIATHLVLNNRRAPAQPGGEARAPGFRARWRRARRLSLRD